MTAPNKPETALTPVQIATLAIITTKMRELGVDAKPQKEVTVGPLLTAYRFAPQGSTRVAQLEALAADLALVLGADEEAPVMVKRMPGETAVSVFVPNKERRVLQWRDVVGKVMVPGTTGSQADLPLLFGSDWLGNVYVEDLATLPHLLIAGSTGSGKSTLLKEFLTTIVYTRNVRDVRLCLADPKQVELTLFRGAPHLMCDIRTTLYQTWEMLDDIIAEITSRMERMARAGVTNIAEYNAAMPDDSRLPRIVVVLDELAEMLGGSKRGESKLGEDKLQKIVALARAAGIHVIAATQRPSVDIVGGVVKNNFTARLAFRLADSGSSMTILGTSGADRLFKCGDMLYKSPNRAGLMRLHAPYASMTDIKAAIESTMFKYQLEDGRR